MPEQEQFVTRGEFTSSMKDVTGQLSLITDKLAVLANGLNEKIEKKTSPNWAVFALFLTATVPLVTALVIHFNDKIADSKDDLREYKRAQEVLQQMVWQQSAQSQQRVENRLDALALDAHQRNYDRWDRGLDARP